MTRTVYTIKNVEKAACTMLLPKVLMNNIRTISKRTGIPSNTIAALALDEYLTGHYPIVEPVEKEEAMA